MAQRRMFSKKITDTDMFLDMPMSTQCLYFHMNMEADDDGFLGNAKTVRRKIGANEDDLKLLLAKGFVIPFENGVVVIKDWKIHNYIRKDTYNPSMYTQEKGLLEEDEQGAYTLRGRHVDDPSPQVRLGKDRLGKDSKEKECGDKPHRSTKFTPPTLEKVKNYCEERNNGIDAQYFIDFYTSKNWFVGKTKMKDWQASVRTWEKRQKEYGGGNNGTVQGNKEPAKRGAFSEYTGTVL